MLKNKAGLKSKRGPRSQRTYNSSARVVQRMYLENIDGQKNHYKFYKVDVCFDKPKNTYSIEATWGRIGSPGSSQVKAKGKELDDVIDQMEKVLLQKLFKRGYNMIDIERWPEEARSGDEGRFVEEDWD